MGSDPTAEAAPLPASLDEAYSRMVAALPAGCRFQALEQWFDPYEGAFFRAGARFYDDPAAGDVWADDGGRDPSPVRALLNLAEKLEAHRG